MRDVFVGFLKLRLLCLNVLLVVIVVLLGVKALGRGDLALGIVLLAAVAVFVVAVLGRLMARRAVGVDRARTYDGSAPAKES